MSKTRVQQLGDGASRPDPEVPVKARRRRFTAGYKLGILEETEACRGQEGKIGELLRREGLYSAHLSKWRRQRDAGSLAGLEPKKRGRKPREDPSAARVRELERENARLGQQLAQAQTIIDVQKKLCEMFNMVPATRGESR
jgi:transposase-like protein